MEDQNNRVTAVLTELLKLERAPDGVVVELQQVGQLVKQDSAWFSHDDLFYPNLRDRSTTK